MTTRQSERHDGGDYRSLRTPTWAEGWIVEAVAGGSTREEIVSGYASDLARIEDAEERYYRCTPAAREAAEATLADDPAGDEWESRPAWLVCLATEAERLAGMRREAAVALGRAGRGESKVRGDSDHYRAMRAARRTLYGLRVGASYPGNGYTIYYLTAAERNAALKDMRDDAVRRGQARVSAIHCIFAVKAKRDELSALQLADLARDGSVRVDG